MDLVGGSHRPPKKRESYMREGAFLCGAGGPVLSLHNAVISRGAAKRNSISLIVSAHAGESAAPGDSALEVVDMRGFEVRACRLIVAAVLIQPRNWVRLGAAVCGH